MASSGVRPPQSMQICTYLHSIALHITSMPIFQDSLSLQTSHHQRPEISKTLKPLKMNENLSLASDFTFVDEAGRVNTQVGTFYAATYGDNKVPVTLLLSPPAAQHQLRNTAATVPGAQGSPAAQQAHNDQQQSEPRSAFSLCPVTKFIDDSIPSRLISNAAAGTTGTHIYLYRENHDK